MTSHHLFRVFAPTALTASASLVLACAACAAGSLIPQIGPHNFYGYGQAKVTGATVAGAPFKSACVIATASGKPAAYWNSGAATVSVPIALTKGEHLRVSFYVRSIAPASAKIEASYEQSSAPYQSSARRTVTAGKKWQKIVLPVTAVAGYPAGSTHLVFHTGFAKEVVEVADVVIAK